MARHVALAPTPLSLASGNTNGFEEAVALHSENQKLSNHGNKQAEQRKQEAPHTVVVLQHKRYYPDAAIKSWRNREIPVKVEVLT